IVSVQGGLDFPELDSVPAALDLGITPAEKPVRAVGVALDHVSGAIGEISQFRSKWVRNQTPGSAFGIAPVPLHDGAAAHPQLAHFAVGGTVALDRKSTRLNS